MADQDRSKICLAAPSYVIYEHVDLREFGRFAIDFGLENAGSTKDNSTVFYSGYGADPFVYVARQAPVGQPKRFVGAGFLAASDEDVDKALREDGAEAVDTTESPGKGRCVRLRDPNGYVLEVVSGQQRQTVPQHGLSNLLGQPAMNGALDKRRQGEFTRINHGPAKVHKLGHYGYNTDNWDATLSWYQSKFNFTPTDILHAPGKPELEVAQFMRVDNKKTYVDHHCFLLARVKKGTTIHHSSFEVEDIDTQFMGHQWLEDKGHQLVWGIGRHVHGSQVFDYWYDSSRFVIEHYADGDVVNEDTATTRAEAGNMAVWGPPVPELWHAKKQQRAVASGMAAVAG
ncbi:hypothetical protein LTR17_012338 [Elasticomyces elasticus]|nr:hypothetical protein LTR17_012338 [Elasticomyces elasticus]